MYVTSSEKGIKWSDNCKSQGFLNFLLQTIIRRESETSWLGLSIWDLA
jgi:hypothetical protein